MNTTPDTRAPLAVHLIELRNRMMIAAAAWLAAMVLCFGYAEDIYQFLSAPLADAFGQGDSRRLIYTSLTEPFLVYLKLAFYGGFVLSFPIIAAQLYLFLAPGLYKHEKKVLLPYLVAAPALFLSGAALAYFFAMPMAWEFFLSFEARSSDGSLPLMLEAKISEYIALVIQFTIAFGLAFQLPVLLTLLVRVGLIKTRQLASTRRYAVVILLVVAAILTPPDVLSQTLLFIPLYVLYEISIALCGMIEKKHEAQVEPHA